MSLICQSISKAARFASDCGDTRSPEPARCDTTQHGTTAGVWGAGFKFRSGFTPARLAQNVTAWSFVEFHGV